jgi:hypothetical protein
MMAPIDEVQSFRTMTINHSISLSSSTMSYADFPWDSMPSEADLPLADVGTKRTTTILTPSKSQEITRGIFQHHEKFLSLETETWL